MIQESDAIVLREFANRVRRDFPDARIWGFGSRARGDASADSDFDVCVALLEVTPEARRLVQDAAWEAGFENGLVIAALCYSEGELRSGPISFSPLIRTVLREGVAA